MAFYIGAKCEGQKDRLLHENEREWTEDPNEAWISVGWEAAENKYRALLVDIERHENFGKPATSIITAAFPQKKGVLCILESVMVAVTKRGVMLR